MDWVDIAKKLPVNGRTRTKCIEACGTDESQLISHNPKGYSRYCFRCKSNAFVPAGLRTIEDIKRAREALSELNSKKIHLPTDYTLDVPDRAATWYYKYGISAELARHYKIGYSPSLDRVILPVYQNDELVSMQMRAINSWQKPKYINPKSAMQNVLFYARDKAGQTCTVITEDILSAIKIGRVHHATSILGTNLSDAKASKLAEDNLKVYIWLDGDKAGIQGAKQARKQLNLLGVQTINIQTEKDPKEYSLEDIRRIIHND